MGKNKYHPPKASKADTAFKVVRAGLGAIPYAGGAAAELYSSVITPPLAKRRDQWMESVGKGLEELEEKVADFSVEALSENPAFITAVMHASQAAIRNHQEEKLDALRNAVLNVAIGRAPDEDIHLMFLNFVDTLTPWHLRILRFFQNPKEYGEAKSITYPNYMTGGPSNVLEDTFSELRERRTFYDQIVKDLFSRGLLNTDSLHVTMSSQGMFAKRTTEMGDAFIAFITSPVE